MEEVVVTNADARVWVYAATQGDLERIVGKTGGIVNLQASDVWSHTS